jgi:hypothetical protein
MDLVLQTPKPWFLDDKINLFECRVDVWQLGVGVAVLKNIENNNPPLTIWSHAAYALISIVFSYFEMIGKSLNPTSKPSGSASKDFNYGFCDVYPSFKPANAIYDDLNVPSVVEFRDRVRNGMYHLAYTKNNLLIHNDKDLSPDDFSIKTNGTTQYLVNPHQIIRTVINHFPTFISRIRDVTNNSMCTQFEKFFDDFHS